MSLFSLKLRRYAEGNLVKLCFEAFNLLPYRLYGAHLSRGVDVSVVLGYHEVDPFHLAVKTDPAELVIGLHAHPLRVLSFAALQQRNLDYNYGAQVALPGNASP